MMFTERSLLFLYFLFVHASKSLFLADTKQIKHQWKPFLLSINCTVSQQQTIPWYKKSSIIEAGKTNDAFKLTKQWWINFPQ